MRTAQIELTHDVRRKCSGKELYLLERQLGELRKLGWESYTHGSDWTIIFLVKTSK